ncbi:RbmA family biofilm matrix protein [Vibrio cholerae]
MKSQFIALAVSLLSISSSVAQASGTNDLEGCIISRLNGEKYCLKVGERSGYSLPSWIYAHPVDVMAPSGVSVMLSDWDNLSYNRLAVFGGYTGSNELKNVKAFNGDYLDFSEPRSMRVLASESYPEACIVSRQSGERFCLKEGERSGYVLPNYIYGHQVDIDAPKGLGVMLSDWDNLSYNRLAVFGGQTKNEQMRSIKAYNGEILDFSKPRSMRVVPLPSISDGEERCDVKSPVKVNITLNQSQVAATGGYVSSDLAITNTSCNSIKFKYWLSIKGPHSIAFPAKAVVDAELEPDATSLEIDTLNTGSKLNVTRGFWLSKYMPNGEYTISLQIVTDAGDIFTAEQTVTKGSTQTSLREIDGLILDLKNQSSVNGLESDGGYVPFSIDLHNVRNTEAKVEFWMTAIGPNGVVIPVHAREEWTIASGDKYSKVRGMNFDKSYPAGEYLIKAQLIDVDTGDILEKSVSITLGATIGGESPILGYSNTQKSQRVVMADNKLYIRSGFAIDAIGTTTGNLVGGPVQGTNGGGLRAPISLEKLKSVEVTSGLYNWGGYHIVAIKLTMKDGSSVLLGSTRYATDKKVETYEIPQGKPIKKINVWTGGWLVEGLQFVY